MCGARWARDSTCYSPKLPKSHPMGSGRAVQPPQSALDSGIGNCGPRYPVPRCRGAVPHTLRSWRNLAPPIRVYAGTWKLAFTARPRTQHHSHPPGMPVTYGGRPSAPAACCGGCGGGLARPPGGEAAERSALPELPAASTDRNCGARGLHFLAMSPAYVCIVYVTSRVGVEASWPYVLALI
jgi:hypothetical protein